MKKIVPALVLALGVLGFAQQASAVVIDFESLAHADELTTEIGSSYTESGFVFTNLTSGFGFSTYGALNPFYSGSTALINDNDAGLTQLAQLGGGAFSLQSISLATLYPGLTEDGVDVTFTGVKADQSTVTQTFHVADGAAGNALSTFTFSGFTDLVSVSWTNDAMYHQFDNVDVTPVPEPDSLALMLAGLGLVGAMVRRRTAAK